MNSFAEANVVVTQNLFYRLKLSLLVSLIGLEKTLLALLYMAGWKTHTVEQQQQRQQRARNCQSSFLLPQLVDPQSSFPIEKPPRRELSSSPGDGGKLNGNRGQPREWTIEWNRHAMLSARGGRRGMRKRSLTVMQIPITANKEPST
jgi:hypothetical protein